MEKLRSIIYFAVLFVVAIGILFWIAGSDRKSANEEGLSQSDSVLSVEESVFDFGNISMAAGVVSHEFKITNTGSQEAIVEQMFTSCMCTQASFWKGDIKKGPFGMAGHGFIPKINVVMVPEEEAVVKVDFDPAAHGPAGVGPVDRTVYLIQKGINRPVEIKFKAIVTP